MVTLKYNGKDIARLRTRFTASARVMDAISLHLHSQVQNRFVTQGASSGTPWQPKKIKEWGADNGRAILRGASATLLNSFFHYGKPNLAVVASHAHYSRVHQLGTVGKGGILPTIKPKKAKALFIPITDRAIHSMRLTAGDASWANIIGSKPFGRTKARRFAVKEHLAGVAPEFHELKKGRLKDGTLEVWDERAGEWKAGKPDFIFLRKVDIPPRPMLPTSAGEIEDTTRTLIRAMFGGKLRR
jgi:phage gpG-like protein